ncbi:MAG: hypothetical protein ACI4IE_07635 [Eubacterium sp.]
MSKSKKAKALLLAFILLFSVTASSLFVSVEAKHACTHNDCQICRTIQVCIDNFKHLGKDDNTCIIPGFAAVYIILAVLFASKNDIFETPVSLRVKISD